MHRFYFSIALVGSLAACGGSGSDPVVELTPASTNAGPSVVDVEITPSGETITVTKSGGPVAVSAESAPDVGTFVKVFDGDDGYTIAFVSTGEGTVAGGTSFADGGDFFTGAFFARTAESDMPTTGSATFTGDYVGMLVAEDTQASAFGAGFTGTASLTVDFEDATVSGSITDRSLVSLITDDDFPDTSVADVTLVGTTLSETGSFTGQVTGGAYSSGTSTSAVAPTSTYSGLIGGPAADEAVGAVEMTHILDSNNTLEIGAFAAGH